MITGYAGFQTWKAFIQQSTSGLKKKKKQEIQLNSCLCRYTIYNHQTDTRSFSNMAVD